MRSSQSLPQQLTRLGVLHAYSSPNLAAPFRADLPDCEPHQTPRNLVRDTYLRHLSARTRHPADPECSLRPDAAAALDRCPLALETEIAALDPEAPLDPQASPVEQALDRAALQDFQVVIRVRAELAEFIRLDQQDVLAVIRHDLPNAARWPDHTLLSLLPYALIDRLRHALASVMFNLKKPTAQQPHYPNMAELAAAVARIQPVWVAWQARAAHHLNAPTADKIRALRQQEIAHSHHSLLELLQADTATQLRKLDTLDACQEDALRFSIDPHQAPPSAPPHETAALKALLDAREQATHTVGSTLDDLCHGFRSIDPRIKHSDAWLCGLMLPTPLAARIEKSIVSSRAAGLTQAPAATRDALTRLHSLGEATPFAAWFSGTRAFAQHLETRFPLAHTFLGALLLKLAHLGARHDSPARDFLRHYEAALHKTVFQQKATEAPTHRARQLLEQLRTTLRDDKDHWSGTPAQLWLLAAPAQIHRLIDTLEPLESAFAELGIKNMPAVILHLVQAARAPTNVRSEGLRFAIDAYLDHTNTARQAFEERVFANNGKLTPAIKTTIGQLLTDPANRDAVIPTFQRFIERVRTHLPRRSDPAASPARAHSTDEAVLDQAIAQIEQARRSEPRHLPQARAADAIIDRFLAALPTRGSADKRASALDRYLANASVFDLLALGTTIPLLAKADELQQQGITFKPRTGIERTHLAAVLPRLMSFARTSPSYPSIQILRHHFDARVKTLVDTFPRGPEVGAIFSTRATLSVSRLCDAVLSYKQQNSKHPITPDDLTLIAQDAEDHYRMLNDRLAQVPELQPLMTASWGAMLDYLSTVADSTERLGLLIDDSNLTAHRAAASVVNSMFEQHAATLDRAANTPEVLAALNKLARDTAPGALDDANISVAGLCAHHLAINLFVTLNQRADAISAGTTRDPQ